MTTIQRCSARVGYDLNASFSIMSANFAEIHHISNTESIPVSLPCVESRFTSTVNFAVVEDIPFDAVLGRDWMGLCREAACQGVVHFLPETVEGHTLGDIRHTSPSSSPLPNTNNDMHDDLIPDDTNVLNDDHVRENSKNILTKLFGSNQSQLAPIVNMDLSALHRALRLHGINHKFSSLEKARSVFLHHICTGACLCYDRDVGRVNRPDRTACRCHAAVFESPACMASAVSDIVSAASPSSLPTIFLMHLARSLNISKDFSRQHTRRDVKNVIAKTLEISATSSLFVGEVNASDPISILNALKKYSQSSLVSVCSLHRIHVNHLSKREMQEDLCRHLVTGMCSQALGLACQKICQTIDPSPVDGKRSLTDVQCNILDRLISTTTTLTSWRLVCSILHVPVDGSDNRRRLRHKVKARFTELKKAKKVDDLSRQARHNQQTEALNRQEIENAWPQLISQKTKNRLISLFRQQTSSATNCVEVCASCAASFPAREMKTAHLKDDLSFILPLKCESESAAPMPMLNEGDQSLRNYFLDPAGIHHLESGISITTCSKCYGSLRKAKIPRLALANDLYLGPVPKQLQDLTFIEESMIARCRSKNWIIRLKEDGKMSATPYAQRGMKGHVIVYPQEPSELARILPPSMEDICTPICIIFVGSQRPSDEWLRSQAKPLVVRREKVREALVWLKNNNPLYSEVTVDHAALNRMEESFIIPAPLQHVPASDYEDALTSRYDNVEADPNQQQTEDSFQRVVITDVDGNATSNELRAAAVRHIKNGGSFAEIRHEPDPVNEFFNPALFPMIYPTLFPWGQGGFENKRRHVRVSLKNQVRHFLSLNDRRFQEHESFLFTAFNLLQRREILLHSGLRIGRDQFNEAAMNFASISSDVIHTVSERVAQGDLQTAHNPDELKALQLMQKVRVVTSHVPGSSASKVAMRNEIRALMMEKGLPSFYLTINPNDCYHPLVKFLAGSEIDIDNMLSTEIPKYVQQAHTVARNPVVAAEFFHIYMNAFFSALLGCHPSLETGILGVVKGYYGCVEAQGRGTLHCHMLVWLEGGLNPNQIKDRVVRQGDREFEQRLISFLNDTIQTAIPVPPSESIVQPRSARHHPSSVRGEAIEIDDPGISDLRKKDLYHLSRQCQCHHHTNTCWKYWKGPPHPKECRFDLDASKYIECTSFDPETGELCLRCLDGMVNDFNSTILEAIRCNMDIQFIGSGPIAKAILYYITDYITKSQLKAHVAYAALDLAVKKLEKYDPQDSPIEIRAKRLLQKCAYSMISHQELSAQQVSSYLKGYEDHYTSHSYQNLYWVSFENHVNKTHPLDCPPEVLVSNTDREAKNPVSNEELECEDSESDSGDDDDASPCDKDDMPDDAEEFEDELGLASEPMSNGRLKPRANQLSDYCLRNSELSRVCLWDYFASFEKCKRKKQKKVSSTKPSNQTTLSDADEDDVAFASDEEAFTAYTDKDRFAFLPSHLEAYESEMRLRPASVRKVIVPIGPALPRRDRPDKYSRYCRLMLILFKPWTRPSDLKTDGQSWINAFADFLRACSQHKRDLMDNMQILHECKDSRDDHFAHRTSSVRQRPRVSAELMSRTSADADDDNIFNSNDDDFLAHLHAIDRSQSAARIRKNDNLTSSLTYADAAGLFSESNLPQADPNEPKDKSPAASYPMSEVQTNDCQLEETWQNEYDLRKGNWKKQMATPVAAPKPASSEVALAEVANRNGTVAIRSLAEPRSDPSEDAPTMPSVVVNQLKPGCSNQLDRTDIDFCIQKYTLNHQQARAFSLVAEHSMMLNPPPLRFYLGGAGGTGKSQVINALTEFFERRGQSRRLRLTSYTGVASRNISGMTLHSSLCFRKNSNKPAKNSISDLIAMWEGVDYLFIDEVSMIGCRFLLRISEALSEAKQKRTEDFGGMNMILAGDFAQLGPIGDKALFRQVQKSRKSKSEDMLLGRLLWLGIDKIIFLTEIMRQKESDIEFLDLLQRLREGRCTDADYDLLNSRVLTESKIRADPQWKNAPVIVSDNAVKDGINERSAMRFAKATGRELHWYYATDQRQGKPIPPGPLQDYLHSLDSGATKQRLGRLPLVLGMPVVITSNFDVGSGIVNGCCGRLKQVRYRLDNQGRRHAVSAVVHTPQTDKEVSLHSLPAQCSPILEDSLDVQFLHRYSKEKGTVNRTQLPLAPGFAMTAHKAQGRTLERVIADIESCSGVEAPYVMVSRVKSLAGLAILRPFARSKISCPVSEDLRVEKRRLHILELQEFVNSGNEEEKKQASEELTRAHVANLNLTCTTNVVTNPNVSTLLKVIQDDANMIATNNRETRGKKMISERDWAESDMEVDGRQASSMVPTDVTYSSAHKRKRSIKAQKRNVKRRRE